MIYTICHYDTAGDMIGNPISIERDSVKCIQGYVSRKSKKGNDIIIAYNESIVPLSHIDAGWHSGLAAICKECSAVFVTSKDCRLFCEKCHAEKFKNKTCPVCGKVFAIRYQDNECCSKRCARILHNNFKNPEILDKIAQTNIKKYGVANPRLSKEIQKKCAEKRNNAKRAASLKKTFSIKYAESRRIKALQAQHKYSSNKEIIIADKLQSFAQRTNRTFTRNKTFDDCVFRKRMRFDFYLSPSPDGEYGQVLIEYDGEQHYRPVRFNDVSDSQMYKNFISCQAKDWYKDFYAIDKNIPLIRIEYTSGNVFSYDKIYSKSYIMGKAQCSDTTLKCFDINPCDVINNGFSPTFLIEIGISCTFKCDKEYGTQICQNFALSKCEYHEVSTPDVIQQYLEQDLSHSITLQGLEPLDNLKQVAWFIYHFRKKSSDPIYVWTGYTKDECEDFIYLIKKMKWENIIIKYGRFIPGDKPHRDELLGIALASQNQYAERI